jgi:hypothetical protein
MFRRLLVGLVLGLVVGGLVAAGLVQGLHVLQFPPDTTGALMAYLTAAVTGVLTGLVAGKPIWAAGARIEAGLKAFFGALLAAGLMFALRQWAGGVHLPVTQFTPAGAAIGSLPIAALPVVAGVLGAFFELDNTGDDEKDEKKGAGGKKRVASEGSNGKAQARLADEAEDEPADESAPAPAKRAKR